MAAGGMDTEQYFAMCEQMGWEPNESEIPVTPDNFSVEAQDALVLFDVLPDRWDGVNGVWLGKDYSALATTFELYATNNPRESFELLRHCEQVASKIYEAKRKEQTHLAEAKAKQKHGR